MGSARFSGIAPGTAKKVSVKLSRKGRTLFRKGKLKVKVSLKVSAGSVAPQTIGRSITLSVPKKK